MTKENEAWARRFFLNGSPENIIKELTRQRTRIEFLEEKMSKRPLNKARKDANIFSKKLDWS